MPHTPSSGLSFAGSFLAQLCGPALILDTAGVLVDANPPAAQLLTAELASGSTSLLGQLRSHAMALPAWGQDGAPAPALVTAGDAGGVHTFACFAMPLFAADGQPAGTLLHLREVGELPADGRSLPPAPPRPRSFADIEEQLHVVLDATCAAAWDWNLAAGVVHFSDQWLASFGYTRDEVAPTVVFWQSIVHPEDRPRVDAALKAHFAGETPAYECANRLRSRSGEYRHNLDRGKVVAWDAGGKPLRMIGTTTDITAQRTAEAERASVLKRLVMATEVAGIGIWELDSATRTLLWGHRAGSRLRPSYGRNAGWNHPRGEHSRRRKQVYRHPSVQHEMNGKIQCVGGTVRQPRGMHPFW